jgi:hypothetical protein
MKEAFYADLLTFTYTIFWQLLKPPPINITKALKAYIIKINRVIEEYTARLAGYID